MAKGIVLFYSLAWLVLLTGCHLTLETADNGFYWQKQWVNSSYEKTGKGHNHDSLKALPLAHFEVCNPVQSLPMPRNNMPYADTVTFPEAIETPIPDSKNHENHSRKAQARSYPYSVLLMDQNSNVPALFQQPLMQKPPSDQDKPLLLEIASAFFIILGILFLLGGIYWGLAIWPVFRWVGLILSLLPGALLLALGIGL